MINYNNPFAIKICDILKPLIGDMMAQGVVKTQSNKLGIDEELITKNHLHLLADGIEKGLVVFIGSDAAKQVSNQIRQLN